jgi:O-antigen/teichoic acid export membrane protein
MQKHAPLGLFFFASLTQSLFYWLLSSVISKVRGTEALGELSFLLSLIGPVSILSGLQLKNYYLSKKVGDDWREILFLRLIFSNAVFFIFIIIILITQPALSEVALSLTLIKGSESWSELCQMRWQKKNQLIKISLSLLGRYLIGIMICCCYLVYNHNIPLYPILAFFGLLFAFFDTIVDRFHLSDWSLPSGTFKVVLKLSGSALLTSLLINLPRYLLKNFHGGSSLGIFSAMFYFYVIPTMLINIGLQGVMHQLSSILDKGLVRIGVSFIFVCSLILFTTLHILGTDFMRSIYSINIEWNILYSLLITASFFFGGLNSLFQYSLLGLNIYNVQLLTSLTAFSCVTLLGLWLIPGWGILGAFASFLLGLLVQFSLYCYFYLKSRYG